MPTAITSRPQNVAWQTSGFANPNNPYDSMGIFHNNALNYIAAHKVGTLDTTQLFALTRQYVWGAEIPDSVTRHLRVETAIARYGDSVFNLLVRSTLSRSYFARVDSAVLNPSLSDTSIIDSIVGIENELALNSHITTSEKGWIFCYAAVVRYSTAYWFGSDTSAWGSLSHFSKSPVITATKQKGSIALGDGQGFMQGMVEGFIVGGVAGGIVGSAIGGPPGTVGGAAGGAVQGSLTGGVAGAALGSIKAAFDIHWPWE
jgi:hypothetical protein